jgi:hypothetical protein
MRVRPDELDNAGDQASAAIVTVMIVPVIIVSLAGLPLMVGIRRRSVGHKRQLARNITLQHIDNSHGYADANALQ